MNKASFINHSLDNKSNMRYYTPCSGYTFLFIVMYRKIIFIFLIYGLRTGKIQGRSLLESCEPGL